MGRPFVAHHNPARACGLTLALAAHEHFDARGEAVHFIALLCHDVRQVIDGAHDVGHLFFEFFHIGDLGTFGLRCNGLLLLAPPPCIR